jgi:hypothetical protein
MNIIFVRAGALAAAIVTIISCDASRTITRGRAPGTLVIANSDGGLRIVTDRPQRFDLTRWAPVVGVSAVNRNGDLLICSFLESHRSIFIVRLDARGVPDVRSVAANEPLGRSVALKPDSSGSYAYLRVHTHLQTTDGYTEIGDLLVNGKVVANEVADAGFQWIGSTDRLLCVRATPDVAEQQQLRLYELTEAGKLKQREMRGTNPLSSPDGTAIAYLTQKALRWLRSPKTTCGVWRATGLSSRYCRAQWLLSLMVAPLRS